MIDLRYLKYVAFALALAAAFTAYALLQGETVSVSLAGVAIVFGCALQSLVIVRLPVFRKYYRPCGEGLDRKHHTYPNQKGAPAASSLVAGGGFALLLWLLGISSGWLPAFIAGLSAGAVSFYHDPTWRGL